MKFPLEFIEPKPLHLDVISDCCVKLDASCDVIQMNITEAIFMPRDTDNYPGPYVVDPKSYPQYLATQDKFMLDDVTVNEIPYNEVSNLSGGLTVSIG